MHERLYLSTDKHDVPRLKISLGTPIIAVDCWSLRSADHVSASRLSERGALLGSPDRSSICDILRYLDVCFEVYLHWRDRRNLGTGVTVMDSELLADTVYGLVPGAEYQVMQTFKDHYQNEFQRGERLHFKERHFLPYHGGHTIIFAERPLYLQEEENASILSNFSEYILGLNRIACPICLSLSAD